jgi:hypothetical protein
MSRHAHLMAKQGREKEKAGEEEKEGGRVRQKEMK